MSDDMSDNLDELLALYVNGRASSEERATVEAAIAEDPELEARLAFLTSVSAALEEARAETRSPGEFGYQRLMREIRGDAAPPAQADAPSAGLTRLPRRYIAPLAAAAALLVGVFIGGSLPEPAPGPPGWKLSAAIYQRLYSTETFTLSPLPQAQREEGLSRLARTVGLDAGDLSGPEGLALQRADLLDFNGRALGQVAFLDGAGTPISLCVMERVAADKVAGDLTAVRLLDVNGVEWSTEEHIFLLIGETDPEALRGHAERFAAAMG